MSEVKALSSRQISMQRRKILGNGGKGSYSPAALEQTTETTKVVETKPTTTSKVATKKTSKVAIKRDAIVQGGRAKSIAFRKASGQGKSAQKTFKAGGNVAVVAKATSSNATSRDIAKKVRMEKCTRGKCVASNTNKGRVKKGQNEDSSSTLSGQNISGTRVGKNEVLTGTNKGSCKTVSGTEYLGAEEFNSCDNAPNTAVKKVAITTTGGGNQVSGTEVGQSKKLTGNKSGECAVITGSEYIPADNQNDFCGGNVSKNSAKDFSVMSPAKNSFDRKTITGGDNRASQSTTIAPKNKKVPQKVMLSQTLQGNTTSGTQVGRMGNDITGSDIGACQNVSGSSYASSEEMQTCGTNINAGANKVIASGTNKGNVITGDRSGGGDGITGSEAGNCKAVTGTAYVGSENTESCDTNSVQEIQNRVRQVGNANLSGTKTSPNGLTGAEQGACQDVTGTETYSKQVMQNVCNSGADIGEVNAAANIKQANATKITGDGWDRSDKVTGVGGIWSATRNASIRGSQVAMPMGANFRPENNEIPMSPITGSSGNTDEGAKVTLSGGARA